jgi:hypothetical protein
MKKCFLFLILTSISLAQTKTVDSKVIEATVFKDRAMVTRSADVNLKKGENQIIFSNLTTDIKDETVRISTEGNGEIKIIDVKVERKYTPDIRKEEVNDLQKKIDALNSEMQAATDQIAIYDSKKTFVESLKAEAVKYANQKILLNSNSTKEWGDLLKFIETNLGDIYKGIRIQSAKRSEIDAQIKALKLTMNKYEGSEPKNYKEIIVKLDAAQNNSAKVNASYIVNSASWYPIYDARVDSKTKMVEFSFYGMIQQTTGEDWNDIKLTFSTADPLSVKNLPELEPWYLDVNPLTYKSNLRSDRSSETSFIAGGYTAKYGQNWGLPSGTGAITGYVTDKETGEPLIGANVILEGTPFVSSTDVNGKYYIANVPVKNYRLKFSYVGYNPVPLNIRIREKNIAEINIPLESSTTSLGEVVVTGQKVYEEKATNTVRIVNEGINLPKYSDVRSKEFTTTFELNTKNTIPSDNSPHKVTIAMNVQPIEFEYTSVPKILPKVYLKGKVVNNNDYPILEGEINIFMDNEFVNKTHTDIVVPTDTLSLALGIDESIKCEKTLKNRYIESTGLFGGGRRVNYDFEIKVVNNRKTKESISVIDQLPISKNEKIQVELISPDKKDVEINADKELIWKLELNPGETKILPLKFYVELPDKTNIYGLE